MLSTRTALATLRPALRPTRHILRRPPHRRTFISSTIQSLSDGFLDLAIALPYPPGWPPYSCTIILVTVVTRLALTVPFSVWVFTLPREAPLYLLTYWPAVLGQKPTMARGDHRHTPAEERDACYTQTGSTRYEEGWLPREQGCDRRGD